jgi:sensor histidine kinase YesM
MTSIRVKIILFTVTLLIITTVIISSLWYKNTSALMDTYTQTTALALMEDAYKSFEYLLTDTEYLSSMVMLNKESIITPLQIINNEAALGNSQLTYNQLINKNIIDSYIGSMYGYKYYITGISIVSNSGFLFKVGTTLYYPDEIVKLISKYNISDASTQMFLLPPVGFKEYKRQNQERFVLPVIRSISTSDNTIVGYVIIYFDYGVIHDIFSTNLPQGSKFEVNDRWGNIIFSNNPSDIYDFEKTENSYVKNFYFAEKAGWSFNMAIPTTAIQANIKKTMQNTLWFLIIIACIASTLSIIILYRITKSLEILKNAMIAVSSGNMDIKTGIEGEDEIGRMGQIFDAMISRIKELMNQITIEENKKRKAEIDFLQAQINPHFISNTLNTIVWMAQMSNALNIINLTKSLITLLHSSMKHGSDFISIKEEITYIKNYVEIQKCCGAYDFEIKFCIEADAELLYTLRFILQPLVENAIVHGIAGSDMENEIRVSVYYEGKTVCMEVFDNGKGIEVNALQNILTSEATTKGSYSSIGLKNIHERIRLYFGNEYGLSFDSKIGEYTRVIVRLPFMPEEFVYAAE